MWQVRRQSWMSTSPAGDSGGTLESWLVWTMTMWTTEEIRCGPPGLPARSTFCRSADRYALGYEQVAFLSNGPNGRVVLGAIQCELPGPFDKEVPSGNGVRSAWIVVCEGPVGDRQHESVLGSSPRDVVVAAIGGKLDG